ncbi:MAG: PAS-domain containing protein [Rhodospirillales bacterium]|nr:MAG: PAS-domain containing protein [Rhodospirillales bacterium]
MVAVRRLWLAGFVFFFSVSPAVADGWVTVHLSQLLGGALAVAVGALVGLILALRSARRAAVEAHEDSQRLVESVPAGLVRWNNGSATFSRRASDLLDLPDPSGPVAAGDADKILVDAIDEKNRARFAEMLQELRTGEAVFGDDLNVANGSAIRVFGESVGDSDVLWILDASEKAALSSELSAKTDEAATVQLLLDRIPLPIWWRDPDMNLAGCNRAFCDAIDSDRRTTLAEQREIAAGYIEGGGRALARRAAKTGMAQSESHHVVIGNSRRLLEFTEAPLGGASGCIGGYATDATALEALQDQLADHIAAHAEVLESLNSAIAIFGADKRLKFFNTAYADQTGIDPAKLEAEPSLSEVLEWLRERRRLPEIVDFPAYKAERDRWFTRLIEPFEELHVLPDQTTYRFVASPHPLGGLIFAIEDVTDRLALESSYNTLIEVQRETLNNLYEGIAVFGGDGRLKLYNSGMMRIWNLAEDELEGGPHISELVEKTRKYFPETVDWPKLKQRIILMVTERPSRSGRLHRADDSVIRYAVVPLPDGNTLLTLLDISDSARVERALRERNLALENADRIKSEFIGNVSYELRTPLNAIVGFTEILDNRFFGGLTDRQADYVECILQASTLLMALIDDILDLATIEAGYMALDVQEVEIGKLMSGLAEVALERADQSDLKIEVDCPHDIGSIYADGVRLRQALFNLVSNAIQFTPPGGKVTLAARREGESMLIIVTDTGIGISAEDQKRIFHRFERVDPNARESGAGLGLALAKSLIELHGGTIELESAPGEGTRAICRVPVRQS